MNDLLLYFVKVNLFILLVGISYEVGFRKSKNFKFGRPYLVLGSLIAFISPLIQIPQVQEKNILAITQVLEPIFITSELNTNNGFSWFTILSTVYLLGAAIATIKLILTLYKLYATKRDSIYKNTYLEVINSSVAFSFFNHIFIGSEVPKKEKEIVLEHEQIHKNRKHSIDIILLQLIQIVLWYNPITYRICSLTKEVHEFEVDSKIKIEPEEYIQVLLSQQFDNYNLSFINQFNSNHLKNRIMRISSNSKNRINKRALIITMALFGLFIFSTQNVKSTTTTYTIISIDEVDKKAEYPGGQTAMMQFLSKEIKYPKVAKNDKSEGTVYIGFTISKEGVCKNFKIKRGVSNSLDQAALDALKKMPKWTPAEKDGKKVAMEMTLPVKFVLPPPPPPAPPVAPDAPKK